MTLPPTKLRPPMPVPGGAAAVFAERQRNRAQAMEDLAMSTVAEQDSPIRLGAEDVQPSLLEEEWDGADDVSFELEKVLAPGGKMRKGAQSPVKEIFGEKENVPM